jgi:hypothetical protein
MEVSNCSTHLPQAHRGHSQPLLDASQQALGESILTRRSVWPRIQPPTICSHIFTDFKLLYMHFKLLDTHCSCSSNEL